MRRVDKKVNSKTQNLRHTRNPQQSDEFFFLTKRQQQQWTNANNIPEKYQITNSNII